MVKDINPSNDENGTALGSFPTSLTNVNGTLFFSAADGGNGRKLWSSDATAGGTHMVATLSAYDAFPNVLTAVGDKVFFSIADYDSEESGLWISDGTTCGTTMLDSFSYYTPPKYLTNVNGTLFFSGNKGDTVATELFSSDGTRQELSWSRTSTQVMSAVPSVWSECEWNILFSRFG